MTPSELVDLAERLRAMRAQHLSMGDDHHKQADLLDQSIRWLDQHAAQLTNKTSTDPETVPEEWPGQAKYKSGPGGNNL